MTTDLLYAILTITACTAFTLAMRFSTKVIAFALFLCMLLFGAFAWLCFGVFMVLAGVVDVILRIKRLIRRRKEELRYEEILGI